MLSAVIQAADPTGGITANPLVLGPLAAFVFLAFVFELVVPGKTVKRLQEERDHARALNEKVIPLAENMVGTVQQMTTSMNMVTSLLDEVVDALEEKYPDERPTPSRRKVNRDYVRS